MTYNDDFYGDLPYCTEVDLTWMGTETDGTERWKCNVCGGIARITPLMMTATSTGMYNHYKPGREPVEVPEAFRKAFMEG